MAVAVKNASETASPGLLDRFAVASLVGALYVFAAIGVAFYVVPHFWWQAAPRSFVNFGILAVLAGGTFLGLVVFGIRTLNQAARDGLKAGIFVCFFWILASLTIASGVGVVLESNAILDAGAGVPVCLGLLAVLLIALGRVAAMPGFEQTMVTMEHQGWFSMAGFKAGQGQRVRRWTIIGILAIAISGVWTLHSHGTLDSGARDWDLPVPYPTLAVVTNPGDVELLPAKDLAELLEVSEADPALPVGSRIFRTRLARINEALETDWVKIANPGDADYTVGNLVKTSEFQETEKRLNSEGKLPPIKATANPVQSVTFPRLTLLPSVAITLPALLFAASLWFAYRMVNVPVFADFLIATEAEMNKVSWTTRKNLVTDTIVVLVTVVLMTAFLFVVDQVWAVVLTKVGVLQTPPPSSKTTENDEVKW